MIITCTVRGSYISMLSTLLAFSEMQLVLLKALLPVSTKYTAQGESRMANIARGKAENYICHDPHQELYTFIQIKWQCFKCSIAFYT